MPRYIDAEALAEEMGAGCIPILENGISGVTGDETCIMDYINNAPTADLLEADAKRIAELEAQVPKWISVNDRLPEKMIPVIVLRKGGKVEQGYKDVCDWWKVYGTRTKHVTHWMPLPEPPKDESEVEDDA